MGEFGVIVEGIYFLAKFIGDGGGVKVVEEVGADERVAAFDVGCEVGQSSFVEESVLIFEGLGVFAFEDF
ncbi:MAG: hypothetical protein NTX52_02515 [Planctomycetota bacterium]|nr:hypothetical protein [Planctomycetota bacterium]